MRYKNSHASLPQIAAELGIDYVLEGSVRRDGGRVRITAQLINVRDQTHVWAREYDREPKDLLAVQTEIAQQIGDEIKVSLGEGQAKRPSAPPSMSPQQLEAYDLYLKGQYWLAKRQPADLQKAVELFEQATAIDPGSAPAWATLADCYTLLPGYEGAPQAEFIGKARGAALRALKLDDQLPEAHTALALIVQNYDWDWQAAEKEFRRAIQLNPNYVTAHHWYAEHLMWRGRFQEAFDENAKAQQLDPLSLIVAADRGVIYHNSRQYDAAIRQFRSVLDRDPDFPRAHMIRFAFVEKGRFPEALASVFRVRALSPPWSLADLAYVEGRAGHLTEARRAVGELQKISRKEQVDQAAFVRAYLGVGDKQQALASLEKAYVQHSEILTTLKVDPMYDPLRGDPRFQRVLQQVGLAQP
jgi:tetratricopeptide (TPR) repeat protein